MKGTVSVSAGLCLIGEEQVAVFALPEAEEVDEAVASSVAGLIGDWSVIDGDTDKDVVRLAQTRVANHRSARLIRLLLALSSDEARLAVLAELEGLLATYSKSGDVLSQVLIAPLENPGKLRDEASFAAAYGYMAAASIIERVCDLQPLLHRLADYWLELPHVEFEGLGESKEDLWCFLTQEGHVTRLLEADDRDAVSGVFGELAFERVVPSQRIALARVGERLADRLYGHFERNLSPDITEYEVNGSGSTSELDSFDSLERALQEVSAITKEVMSGHDSQAQKYLNELIGRQVATSDIGHAVKSLCNVAKRCAEMFRTDFERICVEQAFNLDPTDAWTMIQYADHLKRTGDFDTATELARRAATYDDHSSIALSLVADIAAQRGDYDRAIGLYQEVPDWHANPRVLTAIADNLRRLGKFDDALEEYKRLERMGLGSDRTLVGQAEIAKREGDYAKALSIYEKIVGETHDRRARAIYDISYAGVLKQIGDLKRALVTAEDVIHEFPFLMRARVLRSSIWGLLDQATAGLKELPEGTYEYTGYGEWVRGYTRGLLLLRTRRYQEALETLKINYHQSVVESDEREVLRLAAVLASLASSDTPDADELLNEEFEAPQDAFLVYLRDVLSYHLRIVQDDRDRAEQALRRVKENGFRNTMLYQAVAELGKGNHQGALGLEIDAMLSLAA